MCVHLVDVRFTCRTMMMIPFLLNFTEQKILEFMPMHWCRFCDYIGQLQDRFFYLYSTATFLQYVVVLQHCHCQSDESVGVLEWGQHSHSR